MDQKLPFYSILVTITNLYGSKVTATGGLRVILEIQIESLSLEFESGWFEVGLINWYGRRLRREVTFSDTRPYNIMLKQGI